MMLRTDGVIWRHIELGKTRLQFTAVLRHLGAVLAEPLEQLDGEGRGRIWRHAHRSGPWVTGEALDESIGLDPRCARNENFIDQAANVFDERGLEQDRPRPQLADGERRDGLERDHESRQPLEIEPAVTMTDQLIGHRMHASPARHARRGQLRKSCEIASRKIPFQVDDCALDDVEVIEEPFRRRRNRAGPGCV